MTSGAGLAEELHVLRARRQAVQAGLTGDDGPGDRADQAVTLELNDELARLDDRIAEIVRELHRPSYAGLPLGTRVRVLVGPGPSYAFDPARAAARVRARLEAHHRALTRFDRDSELSRLNARAGAEVRVSSMLAGAVQAALESRDPQAVRQRLELEAHVAEPRQHHLHVPRLGVEQNELASRHRAGRDVGRGLDPVGDRLVIAGP